MMTERLSDIDLATMRKNMHLRKTSHHQRPAPLHSLMHALLMQLRQSPEAALQCIAMCGGCPFFFVVFLLFFFRHVGKDIPAELT
jgi:hypothetical protein